MKRAAARRVCFAAAALITGRWLVADLGGQEAPPATIGAPLPAWSRGVLDIHHITTGRGNSTFIRFPHGATMLIDAGDAGPVAGADARPDESRRAGEWIARYVRSMMTGTARPAASTTAAVESAANAAEPSLDYALITHFHPDHMGRMASGLPRSPRGYVLSGITDVAEQMPIGRLIDRGSSPADYLVPQRDAMFDNYREFVASRLAGHGVERAIVGSDSQVTDRAGTAGEVSATVRIVAANDEVWTGDGDHVKKRFPPLDGITVAEDRPTENMCSVALRLSYGPFSYFTGGDMPGYPVPGGPAWHDLETDVARAIGPTDVHVVNHHGSIEVENPTFLSRLRSRVMILPAWSPTHPSADVLKRMLSTRVYPGPRDVFVLQFRDATKAAIGPRATQVASDHGHVVVRVEPTGRRYWVIVLDDTTDVLTVRSVHGPYASGLKR